MSWSSAIKLTAISVGAGVVGGGILYAMGVRNPGLIAVASVAAQVGAVKVWG